MKKDFTENLPVLFSEQQRHEKIAYSVFLGCIKKFGDNVKIKLTELSENDKSYCITIDESGLTYFTINQTDNDIFIWFDVDYKLSMKPFKLESDFDLGSKVNQFYTKVNKFLNKS